MHRQIGIGHLAHIETGRPLRLPVRRVRDDMRHVGLSRQIGLNLGVGLIKEDDQVIGTRAEVALAEGPDVVQGVLDRADCEDHRISLSLLQEDSAWAGAPFVTRHR